jgi:hypothetical protein
VPATTAKLPPPPAPHGPRLHVFTVGVVDDSLAQPDAAAADSAVKLSRRAGFGALVLTATWKSGLTAPPPGSLRGIFNAARAAKRAHMRLFIVVWNGLGRNTPRDGAEREQFAQYTAAVARAIPSAYGVIVGNEPNLSTFWKPQFGVGGSDAAAKAYENLLARTYDAVKDVDPRLRVHRRRALAARRGPPERNPPDAFADRVHPRPRRRLPRKRPEGAADGRLRDSSLHAHVEGAAHRLAPEDDADHARRLPEARDATRPGLPRHRTAGSGCRSTTPSSASRRSAGRQAPLLADLDSPARTDSVLLRHQAAY